MIVESEQLKRESKTQLKQENKTQLKQEHKPESGRVCFTNISFDRSI